MEETNCLGTFIHVFICLFYVPDIVIFGEDFEMDKTDRMLVQTDFTS